MPTSPSRPISFFDQGPFAFPVTLTDTPGTNDPFLIRDEITRRSLESADLYIVVLTARQPLSDADVNLMRLMHGLNSDRIVVFVNRVDDFADVGYDLAEVIMYVEKKLQANFPGARIPIVAGSAAWANGALKGDDETLDRLLERSSLALPRATSASCSRKIWSSTRWTMPPPASGCAARCSPPRACRPCTASSPTAMGTSQAALTQMQTARWFGDMASASAKAANFELESSRAEPAQAAYAWCR